MPDLTVYKNSCGFSLIEVSLALLIFSCLIIFYDHYLHQQRIQNKAKLNNNFISSARAALEGNDSFADNCENILNENFNLILKKCEIENSSKKFITADIENER